VEEEYIGYTEGYIATTGVDSHGDQLTIENIESMANQLKEKPSLRIPRLQHDIEQPIGYIIDWNVEYKDNWAGIRVKVGYYKSRPDVWEMIQTGQLTGFSFGARVKTQEVINMPSNECSFDVEVLGEEWHQYDDTLKHLGAKVEADVKKAADFPTILSISCSLLSLAGTIYGIYALSKKTKSDPVIRLKRTQKKITFSDHTVEEIIEEIESSTKDANE